MGEPTRKNDGPLFFVPSFDWSPSPTCVAGDLKAGPGEDPCP